MYKLYKSFDGAEAIRRIEDNALIPICIDNTDYQAYLAWVAEGNTPLPADEVTV
jgi:hypothetical protein